MSYQTSPSSTVSPSARHAACVCCIASADPHSTPRNISSDTLRAAIPQYPPSSAGPNPTSLPPCSSRSTESNGTPGASAPTIIADGRPSSSALRNAANIRAPRSPLTCNLRATPNSSQASVSISVCSSTSNLTRNRPIRSRTKASCSAAATSAPKRGISRVFTRPATGAFANTMTTERIP